jgi:osmoprotectant transport system permease protein
MKALFAFFAGLLPALAVPAASTALQPAIVGSKKFTESYVLADIAQLAIEQAAYPADHRRGMGGTIILWEALKEGAITCYPEYTGTIREVILKTPGPAIEGTGEDGMERMRRQLAQYGVGMTGELGFNNTYALVMRREQAQQLGIHQISDLERYPRLSVGLSNEFLGRKDGWDPLCARYGLHMRNVRGMDHTLAYEALAKGEIDVMDAYSTDARIAEEDLAALRDDRGFFPQYKAVFLYRLNADRRVLQALRSLEGTLTDRRMIQLNAAAERSGDYSKAAALYFHERVQSPADSLGSKLARWTARHLLLVGLSLAGSILLGIPLGIWASRPGWVGEIILGITGVLQTVPSLALLALLVSVPFFGIGLQTAITALFLYGLLPIVRNTASGLQDIPRPIRESAQALGLEPRVQLTKVFLPLASRSIVAGIKTSAVVNVGTATLAALIGAGGLGEPIISGLNLNDSTLILEGAVPAALLAVLVQTAFGYLDRLLIPKGLRLAGV